MSSPTPTSPATRPSNELAPGRHELEILPGYGHFDPLTGKNAHLDVFPKVVDFLQAERAAA